MTSSNEHAGRTYVVTGSASGIGAATVQFLRERGGRVIGVDRHEADVVADLSTEVGRASMLREVASACDGSLNGVVASAGLNGGQNPPEPVMRVNFFGAVATLAGLRALLERGERPGAVAISTGTTPKGYAEHRFQGPGWDAPAVEACLADDEERAVALVAEAVAGLGDDPDAADDIAENAAGRYAYGASKMALVRWARRMAPTPEWANAGISLNVVGPGIIDTPIAAYVLTPERREDAARMAPMPFGGVGAPPRHIASVCAYLIGPDNGLVTGQVIFADGGMEVSRRGDREW